MLSPSEFESLVEEALEKLPQKFADLLENVVIVVEDEPSDDDLDVLDTDEKFGIAIESEHLRDARSRTVRTDDGSRVNAFAAPGAR